MSSVCGSANTTVARTTYNQLTHTQRTNLQATALVYSQALNAGSQNFKSSSQLLAYRTGRTLGQSTNGPGPVPSVIISNLQAAYQNSLLQTYSADYNILGSVVTTVTPVAGPFNSVFCKVSDTSSSLWIYLPAVTAVSQITSITLQYYSGYNESSSYTSDAIFCMTRDTNPAVSSILLFTAQSKRVSPPQSGDVYAIGSPDQPTPGPITYPNAPITITDQSVLRTLFGGGTNIVDRTRGFQFYWYCSTEETFINNSQILQFAINYTYSAVCPAVPYGIPDPPLLVQATSRDSSIRVTWLAPAITGGSPILYYTVTVTPAAGGASVVARGFSPLIVGGLTNGTPYTVSVTASGGGGTSSPATAPGTVTPYILPTPPRNLVAIAGNTSVSLSWDPPLNSGGSPVIGYLVLWDESPGVTVAETSTVVTGLTNGTTYIFTVQAITVLSTSLPATSSPVIPATVPDPPTGLTGTIGNSQVALTWIAPTVTGGLPITGYTVRTYQGASLISVTIVSVLAATITGLTNGLPYVFTVTAKNSVGESATTTSAAYTPLTLPSAPTGVVATLVGGGEDVLVSWVPAYNGGSALLSYTVISVPAGASLLVTAPASSAVVSGLPLQIEYRFVVVARTAVGPSPASALSNPVTPDMFPAAPTQVVASFDSANFPGSVFLNWVAPPVSNVLYYTISDGTNTYTVSAPLTTRRFDGLPMPATYIFTVTATSATGTSDPSIPSAPLLVGPPTPPTAVAAINGDTEATVSWTAPVTDGGYPILYYSVISDPGSIIQSVFGPDITTITMVGLTPDVSYVFRVKAGNAYYVSELSAPSAAPAVAPTNVIAVPGYLIANVSWTAPTSSGAVPIDYYIVNTFLTGIFPKVVYPPATSTVITGLAPDTPYYFTVVAITSLTELESDPSNTIVSQEVPEKPAAPTAVRGLGQATVSWSAPYDGGSPITGYTVTSSPGGVTATTVSALSVVVPGLTGGTSYTFTVAAANQYGSSPASDPSNSVIPAAVPLPPTNIVATNTYTGSTFTGVSVRWTPSVSPTDAVTNYYLYPYDLIGFSLPYTDLSGAAIVPVGGFITAVRTAGLVLGRSYGFYLVAKNSFGLSAGSALSNTVIPAAAPTAPTFPLVTNQSNGYNTPVNIGITTYYDVAIVSWIPSVVNGSVITSYLIRTYENNVYRGATPCAITVPDGSGRIAQNVGGLDRGAVCKFTVEANSPLGTSAASAFTTDITIMNVPSVPVFVNATYFSAFGAFVVTLNASSPNGSDILYYTIRTKDPNGNFIADTTASPSTPQVSAFVFIDPSLVGYYTFYPYATNAVGRSGS